MLYYSLKISILIPPIHFKLIYGFRLNTSLSNLHAKWPFYRHFKLLRSHSFLRIPTPFDIS